MLCKTYITVASLGKSGNEKPTLEFSSGMPSQYGDITVKDYNTGKVVTPDGFDDKGLPYFSDKFYQERRKEYNRLCQYDKEMAIRIFWFDVQFSNCRY